MEGTLELKTGEGGSGDPLEGKESLLLLHLLLLLLVFRAQIGPLPKARRMDARPREGGREASGGSTSLIFDGFLLASKTGLLDYFLGLQLLLFCHLWLEYVGNGKCLSFVCFCGGKSLDLSSGLVACAASNPFCTSASSSNNTNMRRDPGPTLLQTSFFSTKVWGTSQPGAISLKYKYLLTQIYFPVGRC